MNSGAHSDELGDLLTAGQDRVLRVGNHAIAPVVLLLHGHGGNEQDMAALLPYLPSRWTAVSLRAPIPHGNGFTWFRVADEAPEVRAHDVAPVADELLQRIQPLSDGRPVAVAGFSQGGAVALQMMRRKPDLIRVGVTLAGFLAGGPEAHDARLGALRPPVFWGRGSDDDVITGLDINRMQTFLPMHTTLTVKEYPGLGHWMSARQLQDAGQFLARNLGTDE